jgi:hypothetical protein
MALKPKPAAPAAATPAALPDPAPVSTAGKGRPKTPLTMAQQRFVLTIVALLALLGSLYVTAAVLTGDIRTAVLAILVTSLGGPVRDAFHHYFPGGQADQPAGPGK